MHLGDYNLNCYLSKEKQMRIIPSNFIEENASLIDLPVSFTDFLKEDGIYHSINSLSERTK